MKEFYEEEQKILDADMHEDVSIEVSEELEKIQEAKSADETEESSGTQKKQRRGLYKYIKVSVKTLDKIIVACIAVIVITMLLNLNDIGFDITYNTLGGTEIETQTVMYGSHVDESLIPTREGYTFIGWYLDEECTIPWDIEDDTIDRDITLYAGWSQVIE